MIRPADAGPPAGVMLVTNGSAAMAVTVSIPTILRSYTEDLKSVPGSGDTLEAVIDDLETRYPGLRERLIDSGQLRRFVNVYRNDEDVRFTGGLTTPVAEGDTITVLPAVAGG
jgi:molybdopterin converting factor small subunit